ncbi:MAG: hypothetical protein H7343_17355 [Undibacterium sp.]|nr:hypothetical protein [Opitutaceae bacterium]
MISTSFVPFLRANSDESNFRAFYEDAPFVRACLDKKNLLGKLSAKQKLWIDIGLDGIANACPFDAESSWSKYLHQYGDLSCLVDPTFLTQPNRGTIEAPITAFLNEASKHNPTYLSVPQLPHEDGVKHNKINKLLAEIAADWRKNQNSTQLILPVIFTHQAQLNTKSPRTKTIKFIHGLMTKNGIDAVWAVDSTLEDQLGTQNFERVRFTGIIDFWDELRALASPKLTICGPYWGLGLVLWARGLVTHFGIGLGSTYRYYSPGTGGPNKAKARVAVESLRRWISSTPGLGAWLQSAQAKLPPGSPAELEFQALGKLLPNYFDSEIAKRQVAQGYRKWIDKIMASPPSGRGVALYQDLSAAFVTGKMLPDLPDEAGYARRPERVAEQLMLNCL